MQCAGGVVVNRLPHTTQPPPTNSVPMLTRPNEQIIPIVGALQGRAILCDFFVSNVDALKMVIYVMSTVSIILRGKHDTQLIRIIE